MGIIAALAGMRILVFSLYLCKLYTPYHRVRWMIPLLWLLANGIAVGYRGYLLYWNSGGTTGSGGPWIMVYLSGLSILCQLLCVRMMTIIPVPERLEYH
jgi:hypothetical protein